MTIMRVYGADSPIYRLWVTSSELTAGTDDAAGTYTMNNADVAAKLGTGSEIIVIDLPGTVLFWDADEQCAYDWTAEEEEDE